MLRRDDPADSKSPATGPGRHRSRRSAAPLTGGLTVAALLTALGGAAAMIPADVLGTIIAARSTDERPAATNTGATNTDGTAAGSAATAAGGTGPDGVGTRSAGPGGLGPGGLGPGGLGPGGLGPGGLGPGGLGPGGLGPGGLGPGGLGPGGLGPGGLGPGGVPAPGGNTGRQPGAGEPAGRPVRGAAPRSTRSGARDDASGASVPRVGTPTDDERLAALEDEVVMLTNVERRRNGCAGLTPSAALRTAMRRHVREVARHDGLYLSHTSDDGRTFTQRAREQGYPDPGAENVARGQRTPTAVVRSWMASPGHRANIVNCDLTAIGVGVAWGDGSLVWGQLFGRS